MVGLYSVHETFGNRINKQSYSAADEMVSKHDYTT